MEKLRFLQTMSVEDFKKGMGVSEIEVKKTPTPENASLSMEVRQAQ